MREHVRTGRIGSRRANEAGIAFAERDRGARQHGATGISHDALHGRRNRLADRRQDVEHAGEHDEERDATKGASLPSHHGPPDRDDTNVTPRLPDYSSLSRPVNVDSALQRKQSDTFASVILDAAVVT